MEIESTTIQPAAGRTSETPVVSEIMSAYTARSPAGLLLVLAKGFAMGSADVVPGVSGGTVAFISGIYEELIQSIRMAGQPAFVIAIFSLRLGRAVGLINWRFLLPLVAGILLAVFTLAPGIEWLLEHQPQLIWSFFFGLVLASVVFVARRVPRWSPGLIASLTAGAAGAFWLVGLVPAQTPDTLFFLFVSGFIAICAMILPGISGSFILVLLGKYGDVINAVNERDFVTLGVVALGCLIGLVTFAQLLGWLFKRYHDLTVAVLTGFMIGSLRKVWPWKEITATITANLGHVIPVVERNVLPPLTAGGGPNLEIIYAIGLALAGFLLVAFLERLSARDSR